jgi:ABC-type transport system involved in multi-copper enzyme maturation permease subunit
MPILRSELASTSRRSGLQSGRATFAFLMMAIVVGTFGAWYYWESGVVSHQLMARVAAQSFYWVMMVHSTIILASATSGALSIAGEKDRQTLGFLLATRLSNAEIILGKLTVRMATVLSTIAAGLPVVLLLDTLGGVDLRLILLAYGGTLSTSFFVLAMAIWCSSGAENVRRASSFTGLLILLWMGVPIWLGATPIMSRLGIRVPGFVLSVNAWFLASNPLSLLTRFVAWGGTSAGALVYAVAWMSGLQVAAGAAFIVAAIARLRSAYRANMGGDGHRLTRRWNIAAFRVFPKRPMGDDPILWKTMQIYPRANLFLQILGLLIAAACWTALATSTFFFARPAFIELWNHGFHSGAAADVRPEFNLAVRFFSIDPGTRAPADSARVDFNLFIRGITIAIAVFLALLTATTAFEAIAVERRRSTWSSLIATPLSGREILRSLMLSALWRLRWLTITMFALLTIGLVGGAIHPLGYVAAILVQAASTWWLLTMGTLSAVRSIERAERDGGRGDSVAVAASRGLGGMLLLPLGSAVLPFLLAGPLGSVVWGALSPPFMLWLVLVSWREMRSSLREPIYPCLAWIGTTLRDTPLTVGAALLIGIGVPALWGYRNWRYTVANFDRLVGRPWREIAAAPERETDRAGGLGHAIKEPGLTTA